MRQQLLLSGVIALAACGTAAPRGHTQRAPALETLFPLASASDEVLCERLSRRPLAWQDPEPRHRRKVIVSDVHLGPGTGDPKFAGIEDFVFDATWRRFLADQSQRGPTDLIVAGDFIEFWQIEGASGHQAGSDQPGALAALEVAIGAHPMVFSALSTFLDTGDNRVIFVAGNHDAELIWPGVQLRIAQQLAVEDMSRLIFVDATAYRHGGLHVEHGHRFDGANTTEDPGPPVRLDSAGVCRLQVVWGEVFVAEFFNDLERQYPFVDNLSPESAAIVWGLRDEPDLLRLAGTTARFADVLLSEKNRLLNHSALRAAALHTLGVPFRSGDDTELRSALWEALPTSDGAWTLLLRLLTDEKYAALRDDLARVVDAAASKTRLVLALAELDFGALADLVSGLVRDPMRVAAAEIPDARIVVFAHTHHPGGSVTALDEGRFYANTGAWVPTQTVAELKSRGLDWTQLAGENREQFPARFPAVVIEYDGTSPRDPQLSYTRE